MQGVINNMINQGATLKKLTDISMKPKAQASKKNAVQAKVVQKQQAKTPNNWSKKQKHKMKGGK